METEKRKYVITNGFDNNRFIALLSEDQLKILEWLSENELLPCDVYWDKLEEAEIDFQ
jgi:hypothetical protein